MAGLNKLQIIGHLGKDVETRQAGESKVSSFSVAITEKYKNKGGELVEKTEWVNVKLWNSLSDIASKYLKKGSQVYIEGKISTSSYDDKDGNKKYVTELIGQNLVLLGSGSKGGSSDESDGDKASAAQNSASNYMNKQQEAPAAATATSSNSSGGGWDGDSDDDLPF